MSQLLRHIAVSTRLCFSPPKARLLKVKVTSMQFQEGARMLSATRQQRSEPCTPLTTVVLTQSQNEAKMRSFFQRQRQFDRARR